MIRLLGILAAGAALAVSATPASAGTSTKPPPRGTTGAFHEHGHLDHHGLEAVKRGPKGIVTDNKDPDTLGAAHARGAHVIASVNVKYT